MSGSSTEFNAVLDLCQHEHRRIVLAALADRRSVSTDDLTAAIVERAAGRQRVDPTEQFGRGAPHLSAILGADPALGTSLGA